MVGLCHINLSEPELHSPQSPSLLSSGLARAQGTWCMIFGRWAWNSSHILYSPWRWEQALGPVAAPMCWNRAHLIGFGFSDSWARCVFGSVRKATSFSCRSAPSQKVEAQRW